jgi:hypothetical protein
MWKRDLRSLKPCFSPIRKRFFFPFIPLNPPVRKMDSKASQPTYKERKFFSFPPQRTYKEQFLTVEKIVIFSLYLLIIKRTLKTGAENLTDSF